MFTHHNIHKYSRISDGKPNDQADHVLVDKRRHSSTVDIGSFRNAGCDTDHYLVVKKSRRETISK
jgi:hypothetical protein